MIELEAHHINPEHDDFWDPDHALNVVFNDGTDEDYSVPYLCTWSVPRSSSLFSNTLN